MTNRDPFASRFDSRDSIGAACGCTTLAGGESVGLDLSVAVDSSAALSKLNEQADKVIGTAAGKYADAAAQVDKAIATGKGVEEAIQSFDTTGKDVGQAIQSFAANPAVHAVMGTIAVTAPPIGTVVAAVGEACLAIAAGAVEVVKALEDVWNDIFMSYEQKAARQWGVSVEEARKMIGAQNHKKEVVASYEANQKAAEEAMVALRVAAGEGDRKAVAALGMLDALMSSDTALLVAVLRFGCVGEVWFNKTKGKETGLEALYLCDIAKALIKQQERAAKMSQADFDHYRRYMNGEIGIDMVALPQGQKWKDENGFDHTYTPKAIDRKTGKVLHEGQKAIDEMRKGIGREIDPKTRRIVLPANLKKDYAEVFQGSLFENWKKLDVKATEKAEKVAIKKVEAAAALEAAKAKKAADREADKAENARKLAETLAKLRAKRKREGIPGAVGDVSKGVLIRRFNPPDLKEGTFRVTGSEEPGRKQSVQEGDGFKYLITPNGRLVRTWWLDVT